MAGEKPDSLLTVPPVIGYMLGQMACRVGVRFLNGAAKGCVRTTTASGVPLDADPVQIRPPSTAYEKSVQTYAHGCINGDLIWY